MIKGNKAAPPAPNLIIIKKEERKLSRSIHTHSYVKIHYADMKPIEVAWKFLGSTFEAKEMVVGNIGPNNKPRVIRAVKI